MVTGNTGQAALAWDAAPPTDLLARVMGDVRDLGVGPVLPSGLTWVARPPGPVADPVPPEFDAGVGAIWDLQGAHERQIRPTAHGSRSPYSVISRFAFVRPLRLSGEMSRLRLRTAPSRRTSWARVDGSGSGLRVVGPLGRLRCRWSAIGADQGPLLPPEKGPDRLARLGQNFKLDGIVQTEALDRDDQARRGRHIEDLIYGFRAGRRGNRLFDPHEDGDIRTVVGNQ
jgi:hypothetical protein